MQIKIIIAYFLTVSSVLSADGPLRDQIGPARPNTTVVETSYAILAGTFTNTQPDRLALFIVPQIVVIPPCTRTNLIFESENPQVISAMLKMLGTEEDDYSRISVNTSKTQDVVLAFFAKGHPISWFVIRRNYDTVRVFIEHQFPDGKWIVTGGKTVNDFESWMQKRSLGFEAGANRAQSAKPDKAKP
jgi:hypothetical protein